MSPAINITAAEPELADVIRVRVDDYARASMAVWALADSLNDKQVRATLGVIAAELADTGKMWLSRIGDAR